jgi:hypothetical protein
VDYDGEELFISACFDSVQIDTKEKNISIAGKENEMKVR